MALDQRILARFVQEFELSKKRASDIQKGIDDMSQALVAAQSQHAEELGIQTAINDALSQLGEAPLA